MAKPSFFNQEFLFKFPSLVKLTLIFAHLKSSDVLQLLSFLYYGHAIISNHKKASIAKFKNLLDLLAINNFSYKESHDGRLILQSLHQTTFECPPNTITFDFNMYASTGTKKEPHVVLSYDATFNLKTVLNTKNKTTTEPVAVIEMDEDVCIESCTEEVVEDEVDYRQGYNDESETSESELTKEHAYHAINNKPQGSGRRSHVDAEGDMGKRLVCNFDCENMVGKDNFDIVDNEVIIETSNENSDDVMEDKQNGNQCSERVWKHYVTFDRNKMDNANSDRSEKDDTMGKGNNRDAWNSVVDNEEVNGQHWKQIIRYRNDYIEHDASKLNVDFDVNFKPIVIKNNAKTNFSIVKTGKCVKNNCYVTVLEQEEYEEDLVRYKHGGKRDIVLRENVTYTATVIDSTNIKQEFPRSDQTVGFPTEPMVTAVKKEHCCSSDSFVNNCGDENIVRATQGEPGGKPGQIDDNDKCNENALDTVTNPCQTDNASAQYRNNIELLIEASNSTNNHARNEENKTSDSSPTETKSCSRPKRKQTLNKRSYDSDDVDFFEPANTRDRNHKTPAVGPYRKAVRRLDFNSFAYKRVKTESDEKENALSVDAGPRQPLPQGIQSDGHANEIGNRASVTSTSGPFECYRRASDSSANRNNRDTSGDERKFPNREEMSEEEDEDDSEATLSVEDFATSAECYDDVAREATLPFNHHQYEAKNSPRRKELETNSSQYALQFRAPSKRESKTNFAQYDLHAHVCDPSRDLKRDNVEYGLHTQFRERRQELKANSRQYAHAPQFGDPTGRELKINSSPYAPEFRHPSRREVKINSSQYAMEFRDIDKASSVTTTDQQMVKEYALSQLGLMSKLKTETTAQETVQETTRNSMQYTMKTMQETMGTTQDSMEETMETTRDSMKSEDYEHTANSQNYKTNENKRTTDTVPYCDNEEMMESTTEEEDNDSESEDQNECSKDDRNTESENDKENGKYSFRNVYKQMKRIHSRLLANDGSNEGNHNRNQEDRDAVDGNENEKTHSDDDEDDSNQDSMNGHEEQSKSRCDIDDEEVHDNGNENQNESSCDDDSSNETDPGYVDNTDEDADYDPYYEEDGDESDDSDHPHRHRVTRHHDNVPRRTAAPKYDSESESKLFKIKTVQHQNSSCEAEGTVYYCTPCNRRYHTKTGFSQHKRFECGKAPAFQCLICCKEFNRKSSLKRHLRQIHKTNLQVNINCVVHYDKLSASLGSSVGDNFNENCSTVRRYSPNGSLADNSNENYPSSVRRYSPNRSVGDTSNYPSVRRYSPSFVSSTSSSSGDDRRKYNRPSRSYCRQDTGPGDNRSKYNRLRTPHWRKVDDDRPPRTYCREQVGTLRHSAVVRRHLFSTRV
ncbi:hypothetical protein WDU94_005803 [Cyamophila willieti]